MFPTPVLKGTDVKYAVFFTRNFMKCPDLHRKIMYGTPTPLEGGGGQFKKKMFL